MQDEVAVAAEAEDPLNTPAALIQVTDKEKQQQAEEILSEEGFCKDDLYTSYLTSSFLAAKKHKKKSKHAKNRRYWQKQKYKALHYAAHRLSPQSTTYHGAIPAVVTPDVEFWMSYYKTKGRYSFIRYLMRGEAVKHVLGPVLEQEGMPSELIYLSMIESGFSNLAHSPAQATGPWQFIAGTAKMYGLNMNYWVDERRDPIKSTIAAATYIRDLYIRFGDWYLAMAAYNAGPGKVSAVIRKTGSRDFWELSRGGHFAMETQQYVPKMLAALILGASPSEHGFNFNLHPADEFPLGAVYVKRPVKLDEVASLLNLTLPDIERWNPELLHGVTPPARWWLKGEEGYRLRLPATYAERFAAIEGQLSAIEIHDVHMHRIRQGETLVSIARRYKVALAQLKSFNPKLSPKRLGIGKMIAIPIPSIVVGKQKEEPAPSKTANKKKTRRKSQLARS